MTQPSTSQESAPCPVCGTDVPAGRTRCPGCGKVFGEDNRCPHCHAVAAVRARASGYLCAACGKPRERKKGTVVLGSDRLLASRVAQGGAVGLRAAGVLSIAAGVLAAILAAAIFPGGWGVGVALVVGAVGVGLGSLSLRAASRSSEEARSGRQAERERRILEVAREHGGIVTVTDVARGLGVSLAEADAALTGLADGFRVQVEVTPEGLVQYVFRELENEPGARPASAQDPELPADEALAARRVRVEGGSEPGAVPVEEEAGDARQRGGSREP